MSGAEPTRRANLEVFAEEVERLAGEDPRLTVVTSDSRGSGRLTGFGSRFAGRMVEVGIAEQNLVAVAAGLAAGGRNVVAVSPASFLTARALEQVKHDVCYSDRPVTLVGISAGVSYGALGSTHHSLHDFAAMRAIHNVVVVAPADNWEAREAVRSAVASDRPVYLRFGKQALPDLPGTRDFTIGMGRLVREGGDGVFVTTGETAWRAHAAARSLADDGYSVAVLNLHTLKPLDVESIARVCGRAHAVVTVEEHSVNGGLGDAVARALLEGGVTPRLRVVGLPDEYTVTGSQDEILSHYGMGPDGLSATMTKLLEGGG